MPHLADRSSSNCTSLSDVLMLLTDAFTDAFMPYLYQIPAPATAVHGILGRKAKTGYALQYSGNALGLALCSSI